MSRYPTVATVASATPEMVCAWCEVLPEPQTDVERTVLRRLKNRRAQLLREQAPEVMDQLEALLKRLETLT